MSRSTRLKRLEGFAAQRQHQAEMNDLKQVAETVRAKIEAALAMYRRGEPIPEPSVRHDGPRHDALRQRLNETRERLMRYAELRERYGIK